MPPTTGATARCTRTIGPDRDLATFANRLAPGQTGCLQPGVYDVGTTFAIRTTGSRTKRITLTSADRRRPALIRGRFWVADSANYWTFTHLRFDGRNDASLPSPAVNGDFSTWLHVDVTNYRVGGKADADGVCFYLGAVASWGYAIGTVIERSRIHDCGTSNNHNHGIYVVATRAPTVIRDNFIYANGDRGIQLYPDANGVVIEHNVLDENGTGVIFGGRDGFTSDGNAVRRNVITRSRIRYNVEAYWPEGTPLGSDNLAIDNCLWASNDTKGDWYMRGGGIGPEVGFAASGNRVARPLFVGADRRDYRQRRGSPCRGYGPRFRVP